MAGQLKNKEQNEKRKAQKAKAMTTASSTKDGKGKPRKHAKPTSEDTIEVNLAKNDEDPGLICDAYIHVIVPPPPPVCITGKTYKPLQPQIITSGPLCFSTLLSYDEFITRLAKTTPCRVMALILSKLNWRHEKPVNGKDKPLTGPDGFRAMIMLLEEKSKERVVIISMPPPVETEEHKVICILPILVCV
jgi:hypothetical protein